MTALAAAALGLAIALDSRASPPELTSLSEAMRQVDYSDLPLLRSFTGGNGAALSYRVYPYAGERVAVLIHGSSGESTGRVGTPVHRAAGGREGRGVLCRALRPVAVPAPPRHLHRGAARRGPHGDHRPTRAIAAVVAALESP